MFCNSTFPGSRYATPLLSAIRRSLLSKTQSVALAPHVPGGALEPPAPRAVIARPHSDSLAGRDSPSLHRPRGALLGRRGGRRRLVTPGARDEVVDERCDR